MSQSRFIFKQVHVGRTGNSDLTRYIAKSDLDHEREGKRPRLLFSERDDELSYWEARKFVSITGGKLRKDELLHYVLSFAEAKEFELLGKDEDERRREVRTILRESLRKGLDSIGVAEMRWVAGVHRNKDNPHLHILFNKNIIEKKTGDIRLLAKLPRSLIAHYEKEKDGSQSFNYGLIINEFAAQVDARHRERIRFLQFENSVQNVSFTRELLSPKTLQAREPTAEEILIGRWLVEEIEAAHYEAQSSLVKDPYGKEKLNTSESNEGRENLKLLREEVDRIDRVSLATRLPLSLAFIDNENLRSIIIREPSIVNIASFEHELPVPETRIKERSLIHDNSLSHQIEHTPGRQDSTQSKEKSLIKEGPSFNR